MINWADRILFIDGEALVIDKPAGLAVHPGPKTRQSLEDHLGALRFGFRRPPSPVHRIDRDTSGCLLLSRNPKAHRRFQHAFEEQGVSKSYLAILAGIPAADEGEVALALTKISSREAGWRMRPDPAGRPAFTRWKVVDKKGGRALVRFTPRTGRTHQLRVHAAEGIGIPIAGDPVYGDGSGPMLLHARSLRLERGTRPPIQAQAKLPPSFAEAGFADEGLDDDRL